MVKDLTQRPVGLPESLLNPINSTQKMTLVNPLLAAGAYENIFVVINQIARTIIIGKLRNIKKLNITLKFRKNIKKYSFIVLFRFKIVIFDEIPIALKTDFHSSIIICFEYEKNILSTTHIRNNIKNI